VKIQDIEAYLAAQKENEQTCRICKERVTMALCRDEKAPYWLGFCRSCKTWYRRQA
jgi:hypothetical protein